MGPFCTCAYKDVYCLFTVLSTDFYVSDVVADSSTVLDLCLIFGGMDTEGEIFEDTLVLPIF